MLYGQLQVYKYAVCVRMPGAHIVTAGDGAGTSLAQIEAAFAAATTGPLPTETLTHIEAWQKENFARGIAN